MAWHNGAGVDIGRSPATDLIAEKNRLVSSIVGSPLGAGGVHAATIKAVGKFLGRFRQEGEIPWVRMYRSYPDWQQQCGLLNKEWERDAGVQRANVVFTLVTPLRQGRGFRREALGGGTWKSTGAEPIASWEVVLSKLYLKRDDGSNGGFTVFEFHLTADHQFKPRVALCVVHPTDHRDCVHDLEQYFREGFFPGQIQGTLQVMQDVQPNYQDPSVAGSMNGPHVEHTTVPVSNIGFSYSMPSIHSSASMDGALNQLGDLENISMLQFGGQHSNADELPMSDDFYNTSYATTSAEDLAPWDWNNLYSNDSFTQDGL